MVEVNPPEFQGANCYTFEDFRQTFGGVVCTEGVTSAGDLLVTAAGGASINVNVAAGTAWVAGDLNGSSGMYFVTNDAQVTVTIAANGAGSSRIDLILATVYDSQYIGAADNWAIEVVQGTAGGGVPAVPDSTRAGYLILGHVTVPASGGTPSVVANLAETIVTCGRTDVAQPYALLTAAGTTTVPTGGATPTLITLATTTHLDSAYFTVASSVVTITEDGTYDIGWSLTLTGSPASWVGSGISKNGLAFANLIAHMDIGDATTTYVVSTTHSGESLSAGNTLRLVGYQNSGSSKTASSGRLLIRKVG